MKPSLVAAFALSRAVALAPGSDIPPSRASPIGITVSGISSGAFQAVQMHVSYSTKIVGVGALAGGPFWCAMGSVLVATTTCMSEGQFISVPYLSTMLENTALYGFIDSPTAMAGARVWLMSAQNDTVVEHSVVKANEALYRSYLHDPDTQLKTVYNVPGEHSQVTNGWGSPCETLGEPFINDCQFDAAGDMLQWLYNGQLTPPTGQLSRDELLKSNEADGILSDYDWSATPHLVSCVFDSGASSSSSSSSSSASNEEKGKNSVLPASSRRGLPVSADVPICSDKTRSNLRSKLSAPASAPISDSEVAAKLLRAKANNLNRMADAAGNMMRPEALGPSDVDRADPVLGLGAGDDRYSPLMRVGNAGTLYGFNQGAFVGGGGWSTAVGMAQSAFVYIPDACLLNVTTSSSSASNPSPADTVGPKCALHVAHHGCMQTQDDIGKAFMLYGGYLPWADANNMVMLFPQAQSNLLNPKGCFDWWGYSSPAYASKSGVQTSAINAMIDSLTSWTSTHDATGDKPASKGPEDLEEFLTKTEMGKIAMQNRGMN